MKIFKKVLFICALFGYATLFSWKNTLLHSLNHDIRSHLLKNIKQEVAYAGKKIRKIYCAMYVLSDQVIFKALVDAQRAGVELEIILDESSFKNSFGKARALTREGIAFYLFEPNPEEYIKTLMHLKLFLFQAQGLSWHGSYNCSKNAAEKNTELVTTSDDPELFQDLVTLFEQLKQHVHVKFIPGIQQD